MNKSKTMTLWLVALTGLAALAFAGAALAEPYAFKPITRDAMIELIAPVAMIALFLERAQEVFISAWRDIEKSELERAVARAQASSDAGAIAAAERNLDNHQYKTRRMAFASGVIVGLVLSALGVRVLEPLMVSPPNEDQGLLFDLVDVMLTAGLIGGGSDGIHKFVSVFTDFFDVTRQNFHDRKP